MTHIFLTSLILSLGNPAYCEREQATATLRILQPVEYLEWGEKSRDAEIANRCRLLMEEYHWQVSLKMRAKKWPETPWIDSLPYTYEPRYSTINNYLSLAGCCPGAHYTSEAPTWKKYRKATQFFLYYQLRAGKSQAELGKLLDQMAEYEKGWIKKNKHSYTFSAKLLEAAGK